MPAALSCSGLDRIGRCLTLIQWQLALLVAGVAVLIVKAFV